MPLKIQEQAAAISSIGPHVINSGQTPGIKTIFILIIKVSIVAFHSSYRKLKVATQKGASVHKHKGLSVARHLISLMRHMRTAVKEYA